MTARTAEKKTALRLPERFRQLKSLHGDPPMSVPYGYVSEGTESFLFVSPVEKRDAMPFHDPETVIDGIRRELGEDQGIIEVVNGITREQRRYIYTVVKTLKRMQGVQYNLTMHLERADDVLQVQGFFSGVRDGGQTESARRDRDKGFVHRRDRFFAALHGYSFSLGGKLGGKLLVSGGEFLRRRRR